jgi:hypothetical protein
MIERTKFDTPSTHKHDAKIAFFNFVEQKVRLGRRSENKFKVPHVKGGFNEYCRPVRIVTSNRRPPLNLSQLSLETATS